MKPRGEILSRPVILLVEDEPLVRLTHVDILREADLWVGDADTAVEAFEFLKQRPAVRVLSPDFDIPGPLAGFDSARLVRQGWPEVGVLVISGKTEPGPGDLPPQTVFAPKPVPPAALVEQIERMIDRAEAQSAGESPDT